MSYRKYACSLKDFVARVDIQNLALVGFFGVRDVGLDGLGLCPGQQRQENDERIGAFM